MKKVSKKLKTFVLVQWLVAAFFWLSINTIRLMNRVEVRGKDVFKKFYAKKAIYVFWHGRTMMLSPVVQYYVKNAHAVSSKHVDGRMMAKLQRFFGLKPIYGSTKNDGVNVLRQGLKVLSKDNSICLSPDGPKGPNMRINDGCLYFAKMSGAPIIPLCWTTTKPWIQNKRWDKYLVAKLFGKIICDVGQPIYFNKDNPNEMQDLHNKLEKIMSEQLWKLDSEAGLPKIEPGVIK